MIYQAIYTVIYVGTLWSSAIACAIREPKTLSQGEIEQRTGLKRRYVSRVENGHTVPSIETLEKLARALEVPMYLLSYEGENPPEVPPLPKGMSAGDAEWGSAGESAKIGCTSFLASPRTTGS